MAKVFFMENNKIITAFCLLKFSVHVTLNKPLISNNLINKTCILLTYWMHNQSTEISILIQLLSHNSGISVY